MLANVATEDELFRPNEDFTLEPLIQKVFDYMRKELPDIKILQFYPKETAWHLESKRGVSSGILTLYTDYNFKLEIDVQYNNYKETPNTHTLGVPDEDERYAEISAFYIVALCPADEFFICTPAPTPANQRKKVFLGRDGKLYSYANKTPYNFTTQCDIKKGIMPCVYIAHLLQQSNPDNAINTYFNAESAKADNDIKTSALSLLSQNIDFESESTVSDITNNQSNVHHFMKQNLRISGKFGFANLDVMFDIQIPRWAEVAMSVYCLWKLYNFIHNR